MRLFYHFSGYVSHLTAGLDYLRCLRRLGHEVFSNLPGPPDSAGRGEEENILPIPIPAAELDAQRRGHIRAADAVILHDDPLAYEATYAALPELEQRRVIAYAVWENETLSPYYAAPLQRVSEVWTCSEFARRAMGGHVARCSVLPHVARRGGIPPGDRAWATDFLHKAGDGEYIFLTVADAVNPRKNLQGLLTAFNRARGQSRRGMRLLLKQYRLSMDFSHLPGVINLTEELSPGRMQALYSLCDAYASAHHAEGWGLGLSSAMAFGKIVIATGYSGNMHFMNSENSLPIPYTLAPVSGEMIRRVPLFTPDMRWAEPDLPALAEAMRRAAEGRVPPELAANAAAVTRQFGMEAISARLRELLNE